MYSYSARSIKAIAEYRYPQINKKHQADNQSNLARPERDRDEIPVKRKQRSNKRAPNRAA